MELPADKYRQNAAFFAGIIHKLKFIQDRPFITFWSYNFKRGHKNTFLFECNGFLHIK